MSSRYWVEFWLNNGAAWFLTYLLYSTWVFGGTALIVRVGRLSAATENLLWRIAIGFVPVLAALRIGVEHVDAWTVATGPDMFTVRGTSGWVAQGASAAALVAALWLSVRLGRAAWAERVRLAGRTPVRDGRALDELQRLARAAGRPTPRLTECAQLCAPVAIGTREICIPAGVFDGLSTQGARAVLAHELSHLVRKDTLWSTWVHVLERVFFVQPLQRWASRRMRETAEFLADDFAVRQTSSPEHLVDALTTFARASRPGVAVSGFAPGSLLLRRVERVLAGQGNDAGVRGSAVLVLLAGLAVIAWFSPAVVPACDCRFRGALPLLGSLFGIG